MISLRKNWSLSKTDWKLRQYDVYSVYYWSFVFWIIQNQIEIKIWNYLYSTFFSSGQLSVFLLVVTLPKWVLLLLAYNRQQQTTSVVQKCLQTWGLDSAIAGTYHSLLLLNKVIWGWTWKTIKIRDTFLKIEQISCSGKFGRFVWQIVRCFFIPLFWPIENDFVFIKFILVLLRSGLLAMIRL